MSNNGGWGKGWADEVTEGVLTEPRWPDELETAKSIATETIITKSTGYGLDKVADWSKLDDVRQIELDGQTISARIVGDLAIHNSVGNSDCFCITHVPTLSNFMPAVPVDLEQSYGQYELVDWCDKVQQEHQQFWQVLHELTPLTVKRNADRELKAKDIIKSWCLSVPIKNKE